MPKYTIYKFILRYFLSSLILLIIWGIITTLFNLPNYILPNPKSVILKIVTENSYFLKSTIATLKNAGLGALFGIGFGLLLGITISYSERVKKIIEPYLVIFQSFPKEVLFPLFVVWFGFGATTKVINSAILAFLPIATVTASAMSNVRNEYLELVRGWGATKFQEFIKLRIPYAIPQILGGLKVALPLSLIGAVLGEFLGGNIGLGHIIISSGATFKTDRLFGAVLILGIIGIIIHAILEIVNQTYLKKYYDEQSPP